ncbi:MAG: BlaI/MecI/CopY family transcriptional regulator [Candidatus Bathyarchaeota archaeon]|jgi:predicted transcriptional regulator
MYESSFDPSKTGFRKTLKEYEELTLRFIWENAEEGAGSGLTWKTVNEKLGEDKTISRPSIILFLNKMVDQGILSWRDATGKGGHRKIYYPRLDETGYKKYLVRTIVQSLMDDFPKETREVIEKYV